MVPEPDIAAGWRLSKIHAVYAGRIVAQRAREDR